MEELQGKIQESPEVGFVPHQEALFKLSEGQLCKFTLGPSNCKSELELKETEAC